MITSYPSGDHEALLHALELPHDAKILDIGGGHAPFSYADVVVDIDFSSGSHRDGQAVTQKASDQQLVQADICALPFGDGSFDFVISLHVLEHVRDPGLACRELMRVAKAGFIETPRKWTEYYAGHPTHRWLIDESEKGLTFEPIDYLTPPFYHFALPPLWQSPELQQSAGVTHVSIPCVQLRWKDRFKYHVERQLSPQWEDREFQASKHFLYAKHLLGWLSTSETVLYHAARAEELAPANDQYRELHTRCLLLNGQVSAAAKRGAGALLITRTLWISALLKLEHKIKQICTTHLKSNTP